MAATAQCCIYFCLLASFVAVNAVPVTVDPVTSLEVESPVVPYEFPDDYSISLEQAVVTRKEFASAALLKMITFLMDEIAQEKKAREEIKEVIEDLEERLKHQEEKNQIAQDSNGQFPNGRRSESKERRPGSCRDLQQAGHSLSGFYIVRGSQRIEIVFCPFNDDKGDSLMLNERIGNLEE